MKQTHIILRLTFISLSLVLSSSLVQAQYSAGNCIKLRWIDSAGVSIIELVDTCENHRDTIRVDGVNSVNDWVFTYDNCIKITIKKGYDKWKFDTTVRSPIAIRWIPNIKTKILFDTTIKHYDTLVVGEDTLWNFTDTVITRRDSITSIMDTVWTRPDTVITKTFINIKDTLYWQNLCAGSGGDCLKDMLLPLGCNDTVKIRHTRDTIVTRCDTICFYNNVYQKDSIFVTLSNSQFLSMKITCGDSCSSSAINAVLWVRRGSSWYASYNDIMNISYKNFYGYAGGGDTCYIKWSCARNWYMYNMQNVLTTDSVFTAYDTVQVDCSFYGLPGVTKGFGNCRSVHTNQEYFTDDIQWNYAGRDTLVQVDMCGCSRPRIINCYMQGYWDSLRIITPVKEVRIVAHDSTISIHCERQYTIIDSVTTFFTPAPPKTLCLQPWQWSIILTYDPNYAYGDVPIGDGIKGRDCWYYYCDTTQLGNDPFIGTQRRWVPKSLLDQWVDCNTEDRCDILNVHSHTVKGGCCPVTKYFKYYCGNPLIPSGFKSDSIMYIAPGGCSKDTLRDTLNVWRIDTVVVRLDTTIRYTWNPGNLKYQLGWYDSCACNPYIGTVTGYFPWCDSLMFMNDCPSGTQPWMEVREDKKIIHFDYSCITINGEAKNDYVLATPQLVQRLADSLRREFKRLASDTTGVGTINPGSNYEFVFTHAPSYIGVSEKGHDPSGATFSWEYITEENKVKIYSTITPVNISFYIKY